MKAEIVETVVVEMSRAEAASIAGEAVDDSTALGRLVIVLREVLENAQ